VSPWFYQSLLCLKNKHAQTSHPKKEIPNTPSIFDQFQCNFKYLFSDELRILALIAYVNPTTLTYKSFSNIRFRNQWSPEKNYLSHKRSLSVVKLKSIWWHKLVSTAQLLRSICMVPILKIPIPIPWTSKIRLLCCVRHEQINELEIPCNKVILYE